MIGVREIIDCQPDELIELVRADISLKAPSTQRAYNAVLKSYLSAYKENPFLSSSPIKAGQYVNTLRLGTSPATIKKHVAILKHFYDVLIQNGVPFKMNPFTPYQSQLRGKKYKQVRPTRFIPDEQVLRLIAAPSPVTKKGIRDRAILAILFAGGLRRSEAIKLLIKNVEKLADGNFSLSLMNTKNGSDYEQPLAKLATESLGKLLKQRRAEGARDEDPLFVTYRGEDYSNNTQIDSSTLYKMFLHYARKVGLPKGVAPHAARATSITKLLRQGLDYRTVQEFSRHSSIAMVEAYDKRVSEKENHPAKKLKF